MLAAAFLHVLRILHDRLRDGVTWALTGSTGFALHGVPVIPRDIDLQTDEAGAYEIERRFAAFVLRPVAFSSGERVRSHFGALRIGEVTVEITGGVQTRLSDGTWEDPVDVTLHQRPVSVEGMAIPVLSLEYEYKAYLALGRRETAALLHEWLARG